MLVLFISCSKKPGDVLDKMHELSIKGSNDDLKGYYTRGTVTALEELEKLTPKDQGEKKNVSKQFAKGSSWKIIEESIDGDNAEVIIRYTEHPVENMKGLDITFKMRKEDGEWKIDMENDIRKGITLIKKMGGKKNYLKNMMKKYVR